MSFNIIEELQEVDGKRTPSIGKCYEYNHSKRKDFILQYTIIANMDKAQCTIGVKLHEHYLLGETICMKDGHSNNVTCTWWNVS